MPRSDNIVGNSDSYLQAKRLLKEQSGGPPTLKTCNVMARTARESPNRQGNSALSDGQTEFRGCNQRNSERDPREESAGVGIIGLLQQAPRSRRVWRFFEPRYRRGSRLRPGGAGLDFLQLKLYRLSAAQFQRRRAICAQLGPQHVHVAHARSFLGRFAPVCRTARASTDAAGPCRRLMPCSLNVPTYVPGLPFWSIVQLRVIYGRSHS